MTTIASDDLSSSELAAYQEAGDYSARHRGLSMLVIHNGEIVFENYHSDYSPTDAFNIYSGTKSFACAIAVAASSDGLLTLDERVADTITEWQADPVLAEITIRQLLTLSSGIEAGKAGSIPTYAEAIQVKRVPDDETQFQYGPVPFQIFGELMRRKLADRDEDAVDYLKRRVLDPIGLEVAIWREGDDGNPRMPAGAFLTAREWAKYGQLILNHGQWDGQQILDADLLAECFEGTAANPIYGLSFWLPMNTGGISSHEGSDQTAERLAAVSTPDDIIKAAGVGGQKMYIIPSLDLVIVRQSARYGVTGFGFKDAEFLAPIFALYQ